MVIESIADHDAGKDRRQEEKGMTEDEMVGWHHWLHGHEFEPSSRRWWRTGKTGVLQSMGLQSVGLDWLNNNRQYSPFLKFQDSLTEQSSPCLLKTFNNGINSSLKNVMLLQVDFLPREWMFQGLSPRLVYLNGSYVKYQSGNRGILKLPRMCISFTHLGTRKITI